MKAPADHEDDEKNIFRVRSANKINDRAFYPAGSPYRDRDSD
jgi:hypothetical protein